MSGFGDRKSAKPSAMYETLKAAILSQDLQPGDRLIITDIAAQYDVSVTPIREALSRLISERLVTSVPGEGYFCGLPSLKELQDLYRLIEALLIFSTDTQMRPPFVNRVSAGDRTVAPDARFQGQGSAEPTNLARRFERILDCILALSANDALLHVGRNAIARTHFIRRADLTDAESFERVQIEIEEICNALGRGDNALIQSIIRQETDRTICSLSKLLQDIVSRPYLENAHPQYGSIVTNLPRRVS